MISIIIPVYNVENYLKRCLDSIVRQTYKDYEVILINDGSNDKSGDICNAYVNNNINFRCINITNGGTSVARNLGLKESKGEYIVFVDSDDFLSDNALECLISGCVSGVDLAVCNFKYIRGLLKSEGFVNEHNKVIDIKEFFSFCFNKKYPFYFGVVWNKIYRGEIIRKYNIRFNCDLSIYEDFLFNLEYLKYINNINLCCEYVYYYEQNNIHSVLKKPISLQQIITYKEKILDSMTHMLKAKNIYDIYINDVATYWFTIQVDKIYLFVLENQKLPINKITEQITKIIDKEQRTKNINHVIANGMYSTLIHRNITKEKYRIVVYLFKLKILIKKHMHKKSPN